MSRPPEGRWPRVLFSYAVVAAAVALAATPVYVYASGEHRPGVVRLASSIVVAIVLIGVRARLGLPYSWMAASAFEVARQREPVAPRFDRRFHELRDQVRFSIAGDRYFEHVLWPELRALMATRPIERPRGRPFRRGPSAEALATLLTIAEENR